MRGVTLLPHLNKDFDIKHALLYWDKIEIPKVLLIDSNPYCVTCIKKEYSQTAQIEREKNIDYQYLIQSGILERPEILIPSKGLDINIVNYLLEKEVVHTFLERCRLRDKNIWVPGFRINQESIKDALKEGPSINMNSLCTSNLNRGVYNTDDIVHLQKISTSSYKIDIELYNVLPSPQYCSFDDILEFKEKRNDELKELRNAIDKLYIEIINSHDIPRSKTIAINELEKVLHKLHLSVSERWKINMLSSLKIELNIPNLTTNSLAGVGLASIFGVSPELGAALGAVSSALKFELTPSSENMFLQNNVKEFSYVYNAIKQLS